MEYTIGHVKRNTTTGEVAVRTLFPLGENIQQQMMEWLCAAPSSGPRSTWTTEVEGSDWEDLYVPPPAEPTPAPEPTP